MMPDTNHKFETDDEEIERLFGGEDSRITKDDPTNEPTSHDTVPKSKFTFIKLNRGHKVDEFQKKDPKAFLVLALVARRADRSTGEAQMGDFVSCGLSYQEYRSALERLETKWHMVRLRPINGVGTLVKILSTEIFDINLE